METGRSIDEIRRDIDSRRESISETVGRLGDRIQQSLDWREYVADHPFISIGAAAGVGFLLSGLFRHRPTPRERITDAIAESAEEIADRFRDVLQVLPIGKGGMRRTIKAAAMSFVAKSVADTVKNRIESNLEKRSDEQGRKDDAVPIKRATIASQF
jgi:ElaB/YqjD/DUF883 family membrane-anchored ribosome-binding protein